MANHHLAQFQQQMSEHLLSTELDEAKASDFLQHLVPMYGEQSQNEEAKARLNIYRNNVILSLSTAIADTFPVVKRLIGDEFFSKIAIDFVRLYPPKQPSLIFYGEGFISFIKDYPGCENLPYLSDVARLEWNTIRAFHSAEERTLVPQSLSEIPEDKLGDVAFVIHPSVYLMHSNWAVDLIWEENLKDEVAELDLDELSDSHLLIYRQEFQVQVVKLTEDCFNFLSDLAYGYSISESWNKTLDRAEREEPGRLDEGEISGILGYLLSLSVFVSASVLK